MESGGESSGGAALDQATFFRAVESSNTPVVQGLLRDSKVDVNALDEDKVTALLLAVYKYEQRRSTDIVSLLLEYGADVNAAIPASCERRVCIVKAQPGGAAGAPAAGSATGTSAVGLGNTGTSLVSEQHSTRKIALAGKTPLLVALELKSALYLKGWDYRHWDAMLTVLASATVASLEEQQAMGTAFLLSSAEGAAGAATATAAIAAGWAAVFESGSHEILEVRAEGKHLEALKLLLTTNSVTLRKLVEASSLQGHKQRLELKDASFTVIRELVAFLYSARLDTDFVRMRGVDLLLAAHKYRILPLKQACVRELKADPDNWLRLVSVALEVNAPLLVFKCAKSILATMEGRQVYIPVKWKNRHWIGIQVDFKKQQVFVFNSLAGRKEWVEADTKRLARVLR